MALIAGFNRNVIQRALEQHREHAREAAREAGQQAARRAAAEQARRQAEARAARLAAERARIAEQRDRYLDRMREQRAAARASATEHLPESGEPEARPRWATGTTARLESNAAAARRLSEGLERMAQMRRESANAARAIDNAARAIDNADGKDEKRQATLEATRVLERELLNAPPEIQQSVLGQSESQITQITLGLDILGRGETQEATARLNRVAESLGTDILPLLAEPMARALPEMISRHGSNAGELVGGLKDSIEAGDGALLSAALVESLATTGETELADRIAADMAKAIESVRKDFDEAHENAMNLDAELAYTVERWAGVLSEEEITAGVEAFHAAHAEVYERRDEAAALFGSTLQGAALALENRAAFKDLEAGGELIEQTQIALEKLPALAHTDAGARLIADALVNEANGQTTFLHEANRLGQRIVGDEYATDVQNAVLRSVAIRADTLAREGRFDEVATLLDGAAFVAGDPDLAEAYGELAAEVQELQDGPELAPDRFALSLSRKVNSVANRVLAVKKPEMAVRFRSLGPALSLGWLAYNVADFANDPSMRGAVQTIVTGAGLYGNFATQATSAFIKKAGLFVTVAFSAFDTVKALRAGDELGAVAAAAPAVGAGIGATIGSIVPGAGTLAGATLGVAIGGLVSLAITGFRFLFGKDQIEDFEKRAEPFLRGALAEAGLPPDAAHRLRDVNDDLEGIGRIFDPLAEELGITPRQLFEQVARLPDDQLHRLVKDALEVNHNAGDIHDAYAALEENPDTEMPEFGFEDASVRELAAQLRNAGIGAG